MRLLFILLIFGRTFCLPADILWEGTTEGGRYCYVSPEAGYSWSEGRILPREGLFSYFLESESPLYPEIVYPAGVDRGDIVRGWVVLQEDLERLTVNLSDPEGNRLQEASGFRVDKTQGFYVWGFHLGIPSHLPGGIYSLTIEGADARRFFIHLGTLEIAEKKFDREQIMLDSGLTNLMTEKDEWKDEEAKKLRELIESFHPDSIFHTGIFILPVTGARKSSGYADRRDYQFSGGGGFLSVHNGIDFAASMNTPVMACGAGKIVFSGLRIITGNTVVLEHLPGFYSLYFHLDNLEVKQEEMVQTGQVLGGVGKTGLATGPHLHWEIRVSGVAVDPEAFISTALIDKTSVSGIINGLIRKERR